MTIHTDAESLQVEPNDPCVAAAPPPPFPRRPLSFNSACPRVPAVEISEIHEVLAVVRLLSFGEGPLTLR